MKLRWSKSSRLLQRVAFLAMVQRITFNLEKKKHLLRKIFGSPYTSNQIYLRLNCFSNYVYLKDIYLTLKEIGKIMFASLLKILLICKFLNFAAFFTKGKNYIFQSLHTTFGVRKLISV